MRKIPVGETLSHAYGFATGSFLKLLGIAWAPLVVAAAVGLMVTPGFLGNHVLPTDHEEVARQGIRLFPFIFALSLVIRAMVGVGVTELALGQRSGTTFVYFSLGAAVWRLIGAWLLFILVMILIYIGLAVFSVIVGVAGGLGVRSLALAPASMELLIGLLILACVVLFFGALIYVMARLTFFIPPVVVAEKQIDLARGWQLTRGSFWRIFAIGLGIFIPLIVIESAIFLTIYGADVFPQFSQVFQLSVHQAKQVIIQQHLDALELEMRIRMLAFWPYLIAANILIESFVFGLMYGASAFAYRAVTGSDTPGMRSDV